MSQSLNQNISDKQKAFLIIMSVLAYLPFVLVFVLLALAFTLTKLGKEIPEYLSIDFLFSIPFFLIWCSFLLWAIFTKHIDRKQKIFWVAGLLVINIFAIPWFYHHMRRLHLGTLYSCSGKIERLAEAFLERHHSKKSLLNNHQWKVLLSQLKKQQQYKISIFLSFFILTLFFIAAFYLYKTTLLMKETHLLAFPFVDIEMWNTLEPAQQSKFLFLDFMMVCSIGIFISYGFFSLIAACVNYFFQSKKQLNALAVFLPSLELRSTDELPSNE